MTHVYREHSLQSMVSTMIFDGFRINGSDDIRRALRQSVWICFRRKQATHVVGLLLPRQKKSLRLPFFLAPPLDSDNLSHLAHPFAIRAAGSRRTRRRRMKQRTKEIKARIQDRPLPSFLQRNRRQIVDSNSAGPAYPKTAVFFFAANANAGVWAPKI